MYLLDFIVFIIIYQLFFLCMF